jgi:hypothetical protein
MNSYLKQQRAQRRARVAAGLCAVCAQPRGVWAWRCDTCNRQHREQQRRRLGYPAWTPSGRGGWAPRDRLTIEVGEQ